MEISLIRKVVDPTVKLFGLSMVMKQSTCLRLDSLPFGKSRNSILMSFVRVVMKIICPVLGSLLFFQFLYTRIQGNDQWFICHVGTIWEDGAAYLYRIKCHMFQMTTDAVTAWTHVVPRFSKDGTAKIKKKYFSYCREITCCGKKVLLGFIYCRMKLLVMSWMGVHKFCL